MKDNSLYYMGKLQKADEGTKYEVIHIPGGSSYVVNTSGKISKNSAGVKDAGWNQVFHQQQRCSDQDRWCQRIWF